MTSRGQLPGATALFQLRVAWCPCSCVSATCVLPICHLPFPFPSLAHSYTPDLGNTMWDSVVSGECYSQFSFMDSGEGTPGAPRGRPVRPDPSLPAAPTAPVIPRWRRGAGLRRPCRGPRRLREGQRTRPTGPSAILSSESSLRPRSPSPSPCASQASTLPREALGQGGLTWKPCFRLRPTSTYRTVSGSLTRWSDPHCSFELRSASDLPSSGHSGAFRGLASTLPALRDVGKRPRAERSHPRVCAPGLCACPAAPPGAASTCHRRRGRREGRRLHTGPRRAARGHVLIP